MSDLGDRGDGERSEDADSAAGAGSGGVALPRKADEGFRV